MSKQEMLNYCPRKQFRKDIFSFIAFSALVMVPLAWLVVAQFSK